MKGQGFLYLAVVSPQQVLIQKVLGQLSPQTGGQGLVPKSGAPAKPQQRTTPPGSPFTCSPSNMLHSPTQATGTAVSSWDQDPWSRPCNLRHSGYGRPGLWVIRGKRPRRKQKQDKRTQAPLLRSHSDMAKLDTPHNAGNANQPWASLQRCCG